MKPSYLQEVGTDPDATARHLMQRAHLRDGLPEIAIGVVFLIIALCMWLQVAVQAGSVWYRASAWIMILLVAPMCGGLPWAIKWLRRRFLIEKVGYVELKPVPRERTFAVLAIALGVAVVAAWAGYRGAFPSSSWILAGTGLLGGLIAAWAGRLPRYLVGGILMAAMGISLGFSRVSLEKGFLILYGFMAVLSLVAGCALFLHFMRFKKGS